MSQSPPNENDSATKKPFFRQKKGIALLLIVVSVIVIVQLPLQIILKGQTFGFDSVHVKSPTDVAVALRNLGIIQVRINLTAYIVTYYYNQTYQPQFTNNTWYGPLLSPGQVVTTNIIIDGKLFTFQTGSRYSITVTCSTGYQDTLIFTA